jgi:hypothetical protein
MAAGGLDLTSAQLERSLGAKLQKEGPPATREGRGQDVACEKEDLRGESWTCVVNQEIAILPDAHAVFAVSVAEDLCWRARLRDDGPDFDATNFSVGGTGTAWGTSSPGPDRREVIVAPQGEVDIASANLLRGSAGELRAAGFDEIVLDLSGLSFIDFDLTGSTGLFNWRPPSR